MTIGFICNDRSDNRYPKDWKFDFSSLPYWDNRNYIPYVYDKFYPIDKNDALCCIYSIAEVSMCNYVGFLAILKNRNDPYLYLNITDMCFCDEFSSNQNGNIIFLQPSIYFEKTNISKRPILIIDLKKELYTYFDTDNYNYSYKVMQTDEMSFTIKVDDNQKIAQELNIKLKSLKWYNLKDLGSLRQKLGEAK